MKCKSTLRCPILNCAWCNATRTWRRQPAKFPVSASLSRLLGHVIYHRLASTAEIDETTPRTESTLPCGLYTHVTDPLVIQQYVVAASKLCVRCIGRRANVREKLGHFSWVQTTI
jgi:hypothetical protein